MSVVSVQKKNPVQSSFQDALKRAQDASDQAGQDYGASLQAGGTIPQAIAKLLAESDPQLAQMRTERSQAQQRLGTVFANSLDDLKGVTDPAVREAIRARRSSEYGSEAERIGGLISDRGASQDKQVADLSGVFNAMTGAKQFGVSQKRQALQDLLDEKKTTEAQSFEGRMDDLTRREKEAAIKSSEASAYRAMHPISAGNTVTMQEAVQNPLLGFLAAGGKRVAQPGTAGGFDFYDAQGNKIKVAQAAAMSPGSTVADLLAGSANPSDQKLIQQASGKLTSPAAKQQQVNAASGSQSLSQIEKLLGGGISNKDMLTSKSGITSLFASSKAKQYRDAARNVANMVARLRTGAQINEKEMTLYLQFVPGPSDDAATRRQKIETLKTIFGGGSGALPPDTVIPDTGV